MYWLKLYVAGKTRNSSRALDNIRRVCQEEMIGDYELTIIDVLEHPEVAEADKVVATPTLVNNGAEHAGRLVGTLCDRDKVLDALDIVTPGAEANAAKDSRTNNSCSAGAPPATSDSRRDGRTTTEERRRDACTTTKDALRDKEEILP